MKTRAITFDLDSTLADTQHRATTMINTEDRDLTDWAAYAQACGNDGPTDVIDLLRSLHPHYRIVLVTSRPEASRDQTRAWLDLHRVPYDDLWMTQNNSVLDPTEWKVRAVQAVNAATPVLYHVDDWWRVADRIRTRLGIPVIIVRVYPPTVEMSL